MVLVAAAVLVLPVLAICPNACSGHGVCGQQESCECFTDWFSDDCSERMCPSGYAFVLSEGDSESSSDDVLAGFPPPPPPLPPPSWDGTDDADIEGKDYLETIAIADGTWQSWHDRSDRGVSWDFESHRGEGGREEYFYVECSNRGACDRRTGLCECYDGYGGNACQRQACLHDCSGHGSCETEQVLRERNPLRLPLTVYTGTHPDGTIVRSLETKRLLTPSADPRPWVVPGDRLRLGSKVGRDLVVATVTATTITTREPWTSPFPLGSCVYHVPARQNSRQEAQRRCLCDDGFTAPDCSARICPKSADRTKYVVRPDPSEARALGSKPIGLRNEKQTISLASSHGSLEGTFTLTFTGENGKALTTEPIPVNARLDSKARVSNASPNVVMFHSPLAKSELAVGDYLLVGEERHEVVAVHGIAPSQHAPHHEPSQTTTETQTFGSFGLPHLRRQQGGDRVSAVTVRNHVAALGGDLNILRAGPALGIKHALEALPNGVIPEVQTELLATGVLLGYSSNYQHVDARAVASGAWDEPYTTGPDAGATGAPDAAGGRPEIDATATNVTVISGLRPSRHSKPFKSASTHILDESDFEQDGADVGLVRGDLLRVVDLSGRSSDFFTVLDVDLEDPRQASSSHKEMRGFPRKIYVSGSTPWSTAERRKQSARRKGRRRKKRAVYKENGYTVRVTFLQNSGNLDELIVDTSGLSSAGLNDELGEDARPVISATVTDHRPLRWISHEANQADRTRVFSGSMLMVAGGAGTVTIAVSSSMTGIFLAGERSKASSKQVKIKILTRPATLETPDFTDIFGTADKVAGSQLTIKGCRADPGLNAKYTIVAVRPRAIILEASHVLNWQPRHRNIPPLVCLGNSVTLSARSAALLDHEGLSPGDRVTVGGWRRSVLDAARSADASTSQLGPPALELQTRSVDQIMSSSSNDRDAVITQFSVTEPYAFDAVIRDGGMPLASAASAHFGDLRAWVNEMGTTENVECSGRGTCDAIRGVCQCSTGFTGPACEMQNAFLA